VKEEERNGDEEKVSDEGEPEERELSLKISKGGRWEKIEGKSPERRSPIDAWYFERLNPNNKPTLYLQTNNLSEICTSQCILSLVTLHYPVPQ